MSRHLTSLLAALALTVLSSCATTPKTQPMVEDARAQLEAARADANAQRYANDDLRKAEGYLTSAQAAAENHRDQQIIDHFAYLSSQSSKIARELGRAGSAEDRIAAASGERERIRLQARTREAQQARQEAEQAKAQAAQATAAATEATAAANEANAAATQAQSATEQKSAELQKAQEELQAMNAQQSPRGLVITLGDMLFDTGRDELKSGAGRTLDTIAAFLQEHSDRHVLIEGFTDSVGSEETNRALSERRADAVRSALVTRGVDTGRIDVAGYGEQYPVGTNADAGGRQLNRRVEVVVSTGPNPVQRR